MTMFNLWSIFYVVISSHFILYGDGKADVKPTTRKNAPFLATLTKRDEDGKIVSAQLGAVVSKQYVLTLGTPLKEKATWDTYYVIVYAAKLRKGNRFSYLIHNVTFHPNLGDGFKYDVALVKVEGFISVGTPITLGYQKPYAHQYVTMVGWANQDCKEMEACIGKISSDEGVGIKSSKLRIDIECQWDNLEQFFCSKDGEAYPLSVDYSGPVIFLGRLVGLMYKYQTKEKTSMIVSVAPFRHWIVDTIRVQDVRPPENFPVTQPESEETTVEEEYDVPVTTADATAFRPSLSFLCLVGFALAGSLTEG